jgi:hypothetical protein
LVIHSVPLDEGRRLPFSSQRVPGTIGSNSARLNADPAERVIEMEFFYFRLAIRRFVGNSQLVMIP